MSSRISRPASTLSDRRNSPAEARRSAGLDQGRCAEIDIAADMREDAYHRNHNCADQGNNYNFQMGGAISAVYRMIHRILPCCVAASELNLSQLNMGGQSQRPNASSLELEVS